MPHWLRPLAAVALGVLMLNAPAAQAGELSDPTGSVILVVGGAITNTNAAGRAEFDRTMLEALGVETLTTTTTWTDGPQVFDGVLASKVLEAVGAHGETVMATALNDYTVEIPVSDFLDYPVLLALRMNGVELTSRDKGPIWVVYPRDEYGELRDPRNDLKWIWQLRSIDIR